MRGDERLSMSCLSPPPPTACSHLSRLTKTYIQAFYVEVEQNKGLASGGAPYRLCLNQFVAFTVGWRRKRTGKLNLRVMCLTLTDQRNT